MEKQEINKFGLHYLLGKDKEGVKHYIEAPSWDCGWYWGFGYIHTYSNNKSPNSSRDINSHYHASSFKGYPMPEHLVETPFTEKEWYTLRELIKTAYTLKECAELFGRGGSHITTNPLKDTLINKDLVKHINETLIPSIWAEMLKILKDESDDLE